MAGLVFSGCKPEMTKIPIRACTRLPLEVLTVYKIDYR